MATRADRLLVLSVVLMATGIAFVSVGRLRRGSITVFVFLGACAIANWLFARAWLLARRDP